MLAKIEVKAEVSRKLRPDKNREEFFFHFASKTCHASHSELSEAQFLKTKPNMGFLKTKPKIELVAFFWNGDDFEIGFVPWDFIADEGFRKDHQDSWSIVFVILVTTISYNYKMN